MVWADAKLSSGLQPKISGMSGYSGSLLVEVAPLYQAASRPLYRPQRIASTRTREVSLVSRGGRREGARGREEDVLLP